jgi:hypothetical protein
MLLFWLQAPLLHPDVFWHQGAFLLLALFSRQAAWKHLALTQQFFLRGCIEASGVPVTTGLPISSPEGTVMYQAAAPSGLYIYVGGQWVQI